MTLTLISLRPTAGLFCAAALLFAPGAVHAQAFTVTLAPQTQVLTPGTSETFSGTIRNNSTTTALYLSGDGFGSLPSGLTTDDSSFFSTFAGTMLGAGQTTSLSSLFTVTDVNQDPGAYTQLPYNVYGGATSDAQDQSGSTAFNVVVASGAPVPEVSTSLSLGLLLAAGAMALMVQRRKRACAL